MDHGKHSLIGGEHNVQIQNAHEYSKNANRIANIHAQEAISFGSQNILHRVRHTNGC